MSGARIGQGLTVAGAAPIICCQLPSASRLYAARGGRLVLWRAAQPPDWAPVGNVRHDFWRGVVL